jgi:hypothetical protein
MGQVSAAIQSAEFREGLSDQAARAAERIEISACETARELNEL